MKIKIMKILENPKEDIPDTVNEDEIEVYDV